MVGGTPTLRYPALSRPPAIAKMRSALDEFRIGPIRTTIPLHRRIMDSKPFIDADFDIHYIERWLKAGAAGFGLGSDLFKPSYDDAEIARRARATVDAFKAARG